MAAVKGISKLSGQAKSNTYPQPEGLLSDCMLMYGKKLGENSIFGMFKWKSEMKKETAIDRNDNGNSRNNGVTLIYYCFVI